MFSSWIRDFIYSAVQGPHWFIFSISKYLYLVLRCFFIMETYVLLLEYIQNVSSSYLVCRLEALSCCMTQFWRRCWTFHSRVFWYTDELMVESKYPHSCGWKTRQNHHPSTIILTSWYVFVLLRSPHTVLCIMATHSQMSFCHFFPWQPFQTTYTCSVFFPIVLS